jgi:DNA-binding NarL/FixJ family response regulator
MFLSEKTAKNYVSSLLAKLGMQRRSQAAAFAARLAVAAGD